MQTSFFREISEDELQYFEQNVGRFYVPRYRLIV